LLDMFESIKGIKCANVNMISGATEN
jgi:hypothetical protein